jgi:hypothetical protein
MTTDQVREIIAQQYETRGVEFKGPGDRGDRQLFAKVVRAALGMANRRDGGAIVVGVADVNGSLTSVGLTPPQRETWRYDDIAAGIAAYADPSVKLRVDVLDLDGHSLVVITVQEFEDVPVFANATTRMYSGTARVIYAAPENPKRANCRRASKCGSCLTSLHRRDCAGLWATRLRLDWSSRLHSTLATKPMMRGFEPSWETCCERGCKQNQVSRALVDQHPTENLQGGPPSVGGYLPAYGKMRGPVARMGLPSHYSSG